MIIDFSKITIYEVFALILSITAILIPIIQLAWKKWVVKPILYHIPTGRAYLFINRSGSYIQIEGVFEAKNKPISVKNITLKVLRTKDDRRSKGNFNIHSWVSKRSSQIRRKAWNCFVAGMQ